MSDFRQFNGREATIGTVRAATTASVLGSDPANLAAMMNVSTFVFQSGWTDVGATNGGVTLSKGFAKQDYEADQSVGPFKDEITSHTLKISTTLLQSGDIEQFVLAWQADSATAVDGTSFERTKGIAAVRTQVHRSLAVAEIDEGGKLRLFFIRDASNDAGDVAYVINKGAIHSLPLNLVGWPSSDAASGFEFGKMYEQDGFGGISH